LLCRFFCVEAWSIAARAYASRRSATQMVLYSPEARANLQYAVVTEPAATEGEVAQSMPRWTFRASGLVFSIIKRTPLYGKIKKGAFKKMQAATESTGVDWDANVAALESVCKEERLAAIVAEKEVITPEYYYRPFHAYDNGNLCWEHACHQPLVSRAVGARNLPGMPAVDGDKNFRGAFDRELRSLLPSDAPCLKRGAVLLDLGCGTGISTRQLLDAFPLASTCVGLDLSPYMIAIGRELLAREGREDARLSIKLGHPGH